MIKIKYPAPPLHTSARYLSGFFHAYIYYIYIHSFSQRRLICPWQKFGLDHHACKFTDSRSITSESNEIYVCSYTSIRSRVCIVNNTCEVNGSERR